MEATSRRIILKKHLPKLFFATGFQWCSAVEIYGLWGVLSPFHVSSTSGSIFSPSGKVPKSHPSIPSSQLRWGNQGRLRLSHGSCGLWKQHYWKAMRISCCQLIHSWKDMKSHHQPPFAHLGIPDPHGPPRSWQEWTPWTWNVASMQLWSWSWRPGKITSWVLQGLVNVPWLGYIGHHLIVAIIDHIPIMVGWCEKCGHD